MKPYMHHIIGGTAAILAVTLPLHAENTPESFENMTPEQAREYELDTIRRVADLSLVPPVINTNPLPEYDYDQLDYGMVLGSARTPKGRLWSAWVGGEDGPKAFMVAATSDDNGKTWSKPRFAIDSQAPHLPIPRSVIVGNFWTDPEGKLWFFFDQTMNHYDGRSGLWATVCENPDDETPTWSKPNRIWHGSVLNKPIVRSNGEWLLPVQLPQLEGLGALKGIHDELKPVQGAHVFASTDQGKTWTQRGLVRSAKPSWPEHQLVELKNGDIWLTLRTEEGAMQSFSSDGGQTWTEPEPTTFKQPVARFHISRLASGKILLIKHGESIDSFEADKTNGRNNLTAWVSEDEGKTWKGGLMLDERTGISYPDGFQAPDGTIYITYDRNRHSDGEILMARITEEDILAGNLVNPDSQLKLLVSRPMKGRGLPFRQGPASELSSTDGTANNLEKGEKIHSDRDYVFHDLPQELIGKKFIYSPIDHAEATITKPGMVYVLTPTPARNRSDSLEVELLKAGFEKADIPEFVLLQFQGQSRAAETCSVYQKEFKEGESIKLGRWGVIVF